MRQIVAIVLMKQRRSAVGEGLANAVIGEVALRTFRESAPSLSPLFGAIFPLTETCSRDFRQHGDGPDYAEEKKVEALLLRQFTRFRGADDSHHFLDQIVMAGGHRSG